MTYDLVIVGGGPAWLCAAVYAARKKLSVVLISTDIGGQINRTWGIENYLGYQFIEGPELIKRFQSQVEQFPIVQKIGYTVTAVKPDQDGFKVATDSGEVFESRTVILATGKHPRLLGVPGESAYAGRGVTFCATCDGPVFAGRKVAVVGGGNSAVSAALDLAKIAEHVYLVSLTPLTADPVLVKQLTDPKITILTEHQTVAIEGDSFVSGIRVTDQSNGEEKRLEVTGVFVEVGLMPNSDPVKDIVELNRENEVPVSCDNETTVPGLFSAGDVTDVPDKQIIIAAGDGAKAALQAHRYIQRQEAP